MSEVKLTENEKKLIQSVNPEEIYDSAWDKINEIILFRIDIAEAKQRVEILDRLPKEKKLMCSDNRNDEIKRTGFNECLAETKKAMSEV